MAAVNQNNHHRPLLVMHRVSEGHQVYDLRIEDEQTLEVHELPNPAVPPLPYRPLAVAGNAVLGVDTAATTHHHHRDDTGPPIMVRVRQDLVVRMNTFILYSSSASGGFEALRLLPDGHSWHVTPLPSPPVGLGPRTAFSDRAAAMISAFFVMGSRVWISVAGQGTFSLDAERGTWRAEFPEELRRLQGRALFVPELGNSVFGLTPAEDGRLLCAYRFDERGVLTWRRTWPETVPWDWSGFHIAEHRRRPGTEMVDLAYMGQGRFCVCRPVELLEDDGTTVWSSLKSLLVLEMRCSPGEIELVRRGMFSVRGLLPLGQYLDLYFLQ